MNQRLRILLAGAALAGAGCVTTVPRELMDAQQEYDVAQNGPTRELAPVQLHEAEKALERANRAYVQHPRSRDVEDLAYLARRKVQLAESLARAELARRDKAQAEVALQSRTREGQLRDEARRARELLVADQLDAERRARDAELDAQRRANESRAEADRRVHDAELNAQRRAQESQLAEARAARDAAQARDTEQKAREQESQRQRDEALAQARAADEKAQRALEELKKIAQVREEPRGTVITLSGSLLFTTGKAELLPQARSQLDEVATALDQAPAQQLRIEGHTDARGTEVTNQDLSLRRAEAVRDYLESRGLAPERIAIVGYGASRPIADNHTADGRAMNRRVEIVLKPATGVGGAGH